MRTRSLGLLASTSCADCLSRRGAHVCELDAAGPVRVRPRLVMTSRGPSAGDCVACPRLSGWLTRSSACRGQARRGSTGHDSNSHAHTDYVWVGRPTPHGWPTTSPAPHCSLVRRLLWGHRHQRFAFRHDWASHVGSCVQPTLRRVRYATNAITFGRGHRQNTIIEMGGPGD